MDEKIFNLREQFYQIKKIGLCKSLRNGTTGLGYTFETLLGIKENNSSNPDYNGIEIKTKLGYTKTPMTLFCLNPSGHEYVSKYLLEKYGYPDKEDNTIKCFRTRATAIKNFLSVNKYLLKLKVNYEEKRLELLILDTYFNVLDNSIFWTFDELEKRLTTKLSYLAFVKGYPYKRPDGLYYRYFTMTIYKLKSFECFLKLIEEDKIQVLFNIGIGKKGKNLGKIEDRGTAFKIYIQDIEKLFDKIYKF